MGAQGLYAILQLKKRQASRLEVMLEHLSGGLVDKLAFSYDLGVDEQIGYAKLGLYHLYKDIKRYRKEYGD